MNSRHFFWLNRNSFKNRGILFLPNHKFRNFYLVPTLWSHYDCTFNFNLLTICIHTYAYPIYVIGRGVTIRILSILKYRLRRLGNVTAFYNRTLSISATTSTFIFDWWCSSVQVPYTISLSSNIRATLENLIWYIYIRILSIENNKSYL